MEQCFDQLRQVLGICVERRVDLGNAVLAVLGMLGLASILLAYRQLRQGQRAQQQQANATRARFVLDLNQEFLSNEGEREFFYRLDYRDFTFNPAAFAQSNDERQLDRLLYKLSYVGKLLRDGVVGLDDVNNIRHIASRTLRNEEVIKYLKFLQEVQIPDHGSFSDAVYLFERMFGKQDPLYPAIQKYLAGKKVGVPCRGVGDEGGALRGGRP
jgi:hypothetical protein